MPDAAEPVSGASEGRGRVAVVIGGANGIGAATARLMAARGWRVAVARPQDRVGTLWSQLLVPVRGGLTPVGSGGGA